jgi:polysaccharide export outer membrane protein
MRMSKVFGLGWKVWGGLLVVLLIVGCKTHSPNAGSAEPSDLTGMAGPGSLVASNALSSEILRVGDQLNILFSDMPPLSSQMSFEDKIADDGTITLVLNQKFTAAGKTRGELQDEIRKRYVPDYYRQLTVTIKAREATQFYYVGGEVKLPNRQIYNSRITLTKAIQSSGDFTDFAKKTQVKLTRVDGRTITVDCKKILKGGAPDPEVFPGDKIWVPRRIF